MLVCIAEKYQAVIDVGPQAVVSKSCLLLVSLKSTPWRMTGTEAHDVVHCGRAFPFLAALEK
jgi:hypothetical protein